MKRIIVTGMMLVFLSWILPAQTTFTNAVGDNLWYNAGNWDNGLPASGNDAIIPSGFGPTLGLTTNETFDFNITVFGGLSMVPSTLDLTFTGTMTIDAAASVTNNLGNFINEGTISNPGGWINFGGLTIQNGGVFDNQGAIQNGGTITKTATGTLTTPGYIQNIGAATISIDGDFTNAGTIQSFATVTMQNGTFTNDGFLENGNLLFFAATTDVINNATLSNGDSLILDATLTNNGTLQSIDYLSVNNTLTNNANIQIGGVVDNSSTIINNDQFSINNATFNNLAGASCMNMNTITCTGNVINEGTFLNGECAIFRAEDGSSLSNSGTGVFTNDGTTYQLGTATVDYTNQNGLVLTDQNELPRPVMDCVSAFTLYLDDSGNATLSIDSVDIGSHADYCGPVTRELNQTAFDCSHVGDNTVTLTLTDGNSASNQCYPTITVLDTISPTIIQPDSIVLDAAAGACSAIANFTVSATDNCGTPTITSTDGLGLASGDEFPIGTTLLTFSVSDGTNTVDIQFPVIVNEYERVSAGISCARDVNVSADEYCNATITPFMVLQGDYGCADGFQVTVVPTGTNQLPSQYLNQSVMVKVEELGTSNSCWSNVTLEDKSGPAPYGCDDITLLCSQDPRPQRDGGDAQNAWFVDCSGVSNFYYSDQIIADGDCTTTYERIIKRSWYAVDANGMSTTCEQTITLERLDLSALTVECPEDVLHECGIGSLDTDPSVTGYPTAILNGELVEFTPGTVCGLSVNYSDDTISGCGNTFTIERKWAVLDWCLPVDDQGTNPWRCSQIIKYMDTKDPTVVTPSTLVFSTSSSYPNSCMATPTFPAATITDCNATEVKILTPFGEIYSNGGTLNNGAGFPLGQHFVTYVVEDECGNTTSRTIEIFVVDETPPTPVCDQITTTSLSNGSVTSVPAEEFDDGATDDCGIDYIEVRRMNDPCGTNTDEFGPAVDVCCADIGDTVIVEVRYVDYAGNSNSCMVDLYVEDKVAPEMTCPADITLNCGDDYEDLTLTGNPIVTDNCDNLTIDYSDNVRLECGTGIIRRTWTAEDASGNSVSCVQRIYLENDNPFTYDDIEWPENIDLTPCDISPDPSIAGEPTWNNRACADIVASHEDQIFTFNGGGCFKIVRNWKVVNWCEYDSNDPNPTGIWEYNQVIKIEDFELPTITNCQDRSYCASETTCNSEPISLAIMVSDNCADADELLVSWKVDANDDGVYETGPRFEGDGMNEGFIYPRGTHRIFYEVEDGCGNVTECSFLFTIEDCKKPTPVCKNGLVIEIMQTGMVPVDVFSLVEPSTNDNCTDFNNLKFSFSADVSDQTRTYTCNDLGQQPLQVWVTDEDGNQDYCQTFVLIQDNMSHCGGAAPRGISGKVATYDDRSLAEAEVWINQNNQPVLTEADGTYQFTDLQTGEDYTIAPALNTHATNGVTTWDIVVLARHILGVQTLDNPYKVLAGDLNNSLSLSASDLLLMRDYILRNSAQFDDVDSWVFVDKQVVFDDVNYPWANGMPAQACHLNNLTASVNNVDFVAVKMGDVTDDASTNANSLDDRNAPSTMSFLSENVVFEKAQTVKMNITLPNTEVLAGAQFKLAYDESKLNYLNATSDFMNTANVFVNNGIITVLWTAPEGVSTKQFLELSFTAKETGSLQEAVTLVKTEMAPEAYTIEQNEVNRYSLELDWSTTATNKVTVLTNHPNPFTERTSIGFTLSTAEAVQFTVWDATGKMIVNRALEGQAGYQEVILEASELQSATSSWLVYKLTTASGTAQGKMLFQK